MEFIKSFFSPEVPKTIIKITQIGPRYDVDIGDSRIHVLNEKSLIWNLKHFGMPPLEVHDVMERIYLFGHAEVELEHPQEMVA